MSRAFVKESDDAGEPLPERKVSPHPNLVTRAGLTQIEARVADLEAELRAARAAEDKPSIARVRRDLRYWTQRRASAQLVPVPDELPQVVRFGVAATVRLADGTQRVFKIVGEDEADPHRGLVSFVSPLGRELTGKAVGAAVSVAGHAGEVVALAR